MSSLIVGIDLKDFVVSSKSVRVGNDGIRLEPMHGKVVFDFSPLGSRGALIVARKGGNGKFRIKSQHLSKSLIVLSKISQKFNIDIDDHVSVSREGGRGEIVIKGFEFFEEIESLPANWKDLVKKCGKYQGIRLSNGKLLATNGGFLEKGHIIEKISTNPPNMARLEGGKMKFLAACQITEMKLNDSAEKSPEPIPFVERDAPGPDISKPLKQRAKPTKVPSGNDPFPITNKKAFNPATSTNNVVYDSLAVRGFEPFRNSKDKRVRNIRSNGEDYLVVRQGGTAKISVSNLEENTDYVCIIEGKRLSGNGKTQFGLSVVTKNPTFVKEAIFDNVFSNKYIQLRTIKKRYGSFFHVHVIKPDNSVGEILIKRIIIVKDVDVARARYYAGIKPVPPMAQNKEIGSLSFGYTLSTNFNKDPIFKSSLQYSRHKPIPNPPERFDGVNGKIIPSTVSGMKWVAKIKNYFPNVEIISDKKKKTKEKTLIGSIGSLEESDNIWLDAFDQRSIKETDIKILNKANKVFSPSADNISFLEDKLSGPKLISANKPFPYVSPKMTPHIAKKDYVVIFHRNNESTKKILDSWSDGMPFFALIGARGAYDKYVIPINEYLSYDRLLHIISGAQAVIDAPDLDYTSSFLEVASLAGVPIISTNKSIDDQDRCYFLDRSDFNIKEAIKEALSQKRGDNCMAELNSSLGEKVQLLLG